jgi:hypothetical protein
MRSAVSRGCGAARRRDRHVPAGCTTTVMNGVAYQQCSPTYYQRVSTGYRVVAF